MVHLQAGHLNAGWNTDDILLEADDLTGQLLKAALQVKRSFSLAESDPECVAVLRAALLDFRNSQQFDQERDAIGIVTSSLSARLAHGLTTLLDCARASLSADDMARRMSIPGYLSKTAQAYFETIRSILATAPGGAPDEKELWNFLRRFHVVTFDLNNADAVGITETLMRSLLIAATENSDAATAELTWKELIALAAADAGRAMSYTRDKLPAPILKRHQKATGFSSGISRLSEHTEIVLGAIRTTIVGKTTFPRPELLGSVCESVNESRLVFVTGDAGSGKSVLVKRAFTVTTEGTFGFALRAVSLAGAHINDVLYRFGLTLSQLQAQTAAQGRKVVWVESLEQLLEKPPEQRMAFLDLLHGLLPDPTWRFVITCRSYAAETVRAAFFGQVGVSPKDVEIGELSDPELEGIVSDFPQLEAPLANSGLKRLLRNPFFLDMAAKMSWPQSQALPKTEREFRDKVWSEIVERRDEDAESGLPQLRGATLTALALTRAKALEPFVAPTNLDTRALNRLVRDNVLHTSQAGSDLYAPTHDVFEDWALMRWLDEKYRKCSQSLRELTKEIGVYPALRRAYRKWLTEALDAAEEPHSQILDLVQDENVPAHWREDTLVAVLLSRKAKSFLTDNSAILLRDEAKLLRFVISMLRVACRTAIPRRMFGVESEGEFFLPKGNGWFAAAPLMQEAIPALDEEDLIFVIGFLEDWILWTRYGFHYPRGSCSIAAIAWHWLPLVPWRGPVDDGKERILRVLLAIPLAAEPELSNCVNKAFTDESERSELIVKLMFNHLACDAVVRDMPDLAFGVAERLLGLHRTLEETIADRAHYETEAINYAFGLGTRFTMDDYPASAYHGPYLRMLWHHPDRAVDFIIRLVNRACDAFADPKNRYQFIDPPGQIKIQLPDGQWKTQHADGRLYGAYRGSSVTPYTFQSALMALETWLLQKSRRNDADLEPVLLKLLTDTNNVALTAVVASVAAAHPLAAGEASFTLLTSRALLRADHDRSVQEPFNLTGADLFGLGAADAERGIYEKERKESAQLEHRRRNLEYVAVLLQMTDRFRERVWVLLDGYKAELPPEAEQDAATKVWRIQLHRIDTRNFVEAGRTEDGQIIIGSSEPAPDLQKFIQSEEPHFANFDAAMNLLTWGQAVFHGRADPSSPEQWRDKLLVAQNLIENGYGSDDEPAAGGPAYVASVCTRDHWMEMSAEEQDWCATIICDAIERDAEVSDHLSVVARNPMESSRPAAYVIGALFEKELRASVKSRLLPTLAKAILHAVDEVVAYAVQGVARFMWRTDRDLALICVQALMMKAVRTEQFHEEQRSRRFNERKSEEDFSIALRAELRQAIVARQPAAEEQLTAIRLSRWPGLSLYKYLFQRCRSSARRSIRATHHGTGDCRITARMGSGFAPPLDTSPSRQ